MPFRFRLAKVLKVRERALEEQTRVVAAADRARQVCLQREEELAAAYRRLVAAPPAEQGTRLDIRDLAEQALRLRDLARQRTEAAQRTRLATAELEVQRGQLTEAWREVEVLRKLEQRRREQWEEQQRRLDSRQLDEIGGLRADRLRRSKVSA